MVSVQGKQQGSEERACVDVQPFEKVVLMKFHKIAAIIALVTAGSAHADIALLGSSMYSTLSGTNGAVIGGVTFASAPPQLQHQDPWYAEHHRPGCRWWPYRWRDRH